MEDYATTILITPIRAKFVPSQDVVISEPYIDLFLGFRSNPQQFRPSIFRGDWADPNLHPDKNRPVRFLTRVKINKFTFFDIVRQGADLFAIKIERQ